MGRITKLTASFVVAALLLAACGADDATDDAAGEVATDDAAGQADDDAAGQVDDDDAAPPDAPPVEGAWAGTGGGADGVLRVAFVYVGPVGDAGWTYSHDQGRLALEAAFGDRVETTYLESVEEGAPAERVFEDLAREGYHLIFGTSFGFMDPMAAVAPSFPNTVFEHASGYTTLPNLGTYFGAMEEPRYLSGMAAAMLSESGQLGYVAAFPIPEVIRGINAFALGAQQIDPDATVEVVWTSTWFGPEIELEAAETLLDRGVDVLAQHQDTAAGGQAAEARDALWVGYHSDQSQFAPDAWLTAPVWDWSTHYIETAEQVWDGTWTSREVYGSMADGMVGLAPYGPAVGDDARALVDERAEEIIAGSVAPFTGPLRDQDATVRVEDGVEMTLGELLSMDWFVQGVVGSAGG